ncbi:MAG: hypothetical protein ACI9ZT_002009 [Gammaproteobacteria bacterium]|jgi:hypothetical protein
MSVTKEKFSSQADAQILAEIKQIASGEGRQLQSVLDEALRDFIEKKRTGKPRRHVMEAFDESLKVNDKLYEKLAR